MVFRKDGRLFTSSYYAGVYYAEKDTLLPLRYAPFPAWSMKLDDHGAFWLAATQGIMCERGDTVVRFKDVRDAHDIAFRGDTVAVAHMKGISLFDRETGRSVADYCKGIVCWTLVRFDSVLVAGGSNVCAIIGEGGCRLVRVPPAGNMVWAIERDSSGALFLGTQKGLFRAGPRAETAECVGCAGQCVKSLLFDKKGRLWVGTFYKGR
jgi:ligand-binding sensor domain-containing protein